MQESGVFAAAMCMRRISLAYHASDTHLDAMLVIVRLRVLGVAGLQIRSSMMKDFKKRPWSYRSAPSDRSVLSLRKISS